MARQKKWRDEELESTRSILHQYVDGMPSRLSRPNVLQVSMLLDDLVLKSQKGQAKNCDFWQS